MRWLHQVRAQDQEKPWFVYYSTGCTHAPHQVAVEWSEKYRGKFDQGWDVLREETFERQKKLGVIPPDAELTPRPDALPAWDSLSDSEKKLYARQMEVYAGFQENADWNVGRLLDAVEEMGELDNTLVIYIFGDNGASLEGTLTGSFNELTMQNGIALTPEQQLSLIEQYGGLDAWGTDAYAPHYAAAWAWAGNTPFQWGKQVASHLGGTRNGMVVSWPERIKDAGGLRTQFTHVHRHRADDPRSGRHPRAQGRRRDRAEADGGDELPLHLRRRERSRSATPCSTSRSSATGRSTRTAGGPPASSTGSRGTCRRRRWRGSRPEPTTRSRTSGSCTTCPTTSRRRTTSPRRTRRSSPSSRSSSGRRPRSTTCCRCWPAFSVFFGILPPMPTITTQTFYGDVENIASGMIPRIYGRSYAIEAELSVPDEGAEGVIVAEADEMGGFSLWVDENGLLHHSYSMMGVEHYEQVSTEPIPTGDVMVRMQFDADRQERSAGGTVSLYANDAKIGEGRIERTVAVRFSGYAGMDIGRDNGLPVDRAYADKSPYPFTGTVKKVVFDLKPGSHEDEKALHEAGAHVAAAHGISA